MHHLSFSRHLDDRPFLAYASTCPAASASIDVDLRRICHGYRSYRAYTDTQAASYAQRFINLIFHLFGSLVRLLPWILTPLPLPPPVPAPDVPLAPEMIRLKSTYFHNIILTLQSLLPDQRSSQRHQQHLIYAQARMGCRYHSIQRSLSRSESCQGMVRPYRRQNALHHRF